MKVTTKVFYSEPEFDTCLLLELVLQYKTAIRICQSFSKGKRNEA
jgi:hypothetical protein